MIAGFRIAVLCALGLLGAGCAAEGRPSLAEMEAESASPAAPELVVAHREQATALAAAPSVSPPAGPLPADLRRGVEAAQRRVEELLRDRPGAISFRDLTDPESRALLELARDEETLRRVLSRGVKLEEIGALVFARDRRVAAAWRALEAAVHRFPQVAYVQALASQYRSFLDALAPGAGSPLHRDPVAMHLPPSGVLALKADLVSREVDLARLAFEKVVRDRALAAETSLLQLWYVAEALSFKREMIRYLGQLEETVSSRVETARADKSQALRMQVEIAALEDDVRTLEEQMQTTRARLCELLDLAGDAEMGAPRLTAALHAAPEDPAVLYERARRDRLEVRIALEKARRIETVIALAEKMSQPDWSLGLGYFRGIRASDRPTGAAGVLPEDFGQRPPGARNFWFGQKEAFLREARTRQQALLESLAAEQRSAEYLVRRELFAQDTAGRTLRLHQDVLLTQARQAYEDTLAAYQSERASFADVIDALRQWLRFDLEQDAARRDYLAAHLRLEAAVGGAIGP